MSGNRNTTGFHSSGIGDKEAYVKPKQRQLATTGHTITMTIPSHKYGHGEYGSWQRHIEVETYDQNNVCAQTNQAYTNDYLDNGVGWNLWTASS